MEGRGCQHMKPLQGKTMEPQNSDRGPRRPVHGGTVNPPRNRKGASGNPPPKGRTERAPSVFTKLQRIAELARTSPDEKFISLAHLLNDELLKVAYDRTRKNAAVGVDGQTAEDYGRNLQSNLEKLIERLKAGRYRAPGVRRVHIPKGKGETRPIGIPKVDSFCTSCREL